MEWHLFKYTFAIKAISFIPGIDCWILFGSSFVTKILQENLLRQNRKKNRREIRIWSDFRLSRHTLDWL